MAGRLKKAEERRSRRTEGNAPAAPPQARRDAGTPLFRDAFPRNPRRKSRASSQWKSQRKSQPSSAFG